MLTPAFWYFCYAWFGYSYAGALLAALVIGLSAKLTLARPFPPLQIAAIALLVIGSFVGYVWIDSKMWTPFMFGESAKRFSKDIVAILFIAMSAYLVFVLATPRLAAMMSRDNSQR